MNAMKIVDKFMADLRYLVMQLNENGDYESGQAAQTTLVVVDDLADKAPLETIEIPPDTSAGENEQPATLTRKDVPPLTDAIRWLEEVKPDNGNYQNAQATLERLRNLVERARGAA